MSGGTGGGGTICDAPKLHFESTDETLGCGTGGCHDPISGPTNGVDLVSANVWSRLFQVPAMKGTGCMGMNLVNATKPPSGALIKRVTDQSCGPLSLMPFGQPVPNQAIISCITDWVNSQLP